MPAVALTNLLLDVINPRFETEQQNQRDAINKMAVEQGDKILNLAEDIVQFGVDPSSFPLVITADDGIKQIVVEGNRRIAALKLLHNPLGYAPNRLSDDFHVLPVLLGACRVLRVTGQLLDIAQSIPAVRPSPEGS